MTHGFDADTIEAIHDELEHFAGVQAQGVVALFDPDAGVVTAVGNADLGAVRWTFPIVVGSGRGTLWLAGTCQDPSDGMFSAVVDMASRMARVLSAGSSP